MPRYELVITDPDGGEPTTGTHDSDETYGTGDTFEHEGQTLEVTAVEAAADPGFDQKLICAVEGGRPHYF